MSLGKTAPDVDGAAPVVDDDEGCAFCAPGGVSNDAGISTYANVLSTPLHNKVSCEYIQFLIPINSSIRPAYVN